MENAKRQWEVKLGNGKAYLQAGRCRCLILNQHDLGPMFKSIADARARMPELQLMETAPELLEALEELTKDCTSFNGTTCIPSASIRDKARKAIAKATGQEAD